MTVVEQRWLYLGPEGTFTHAAALRFISDAERLTPAGSVDEVVRAVANGDATDGVIPIENSVEGYVTPALDALVASEEVVAIEETTIDITFNAYRLPGDDSELQRVISHPHALAQCAQYIAGLGVPNDVATSTAAACRDLTEGSIAIGSALLGDLYGVETVATQVEDFSGASTRFVRIVSRDVAQRVIAERGGGDRVRTMLVITPQQIGPGVLARIATTMGERGVNMSSLVTRPLKAQENKYTFIVTADASPRDKDLHDVLNDLLSTGNGVKTVGSMVHALEGAADADAPALPAGSVDSTSSAAEVTRMLLW